MVSYAVNTKSAVMSPFAEAALAMKSDQDKHQRQRMRASSIEGMFEAG